MVDHRVALAFGLVLAAAGSTALGASTVFFSKHTNHKMLAASLGISAGVMMYVSFVEIFATKSFQGWLDAGYTRNEATRFATLCFFGGMAVLWLLDKIVHAVLGIARQIKELKKLHRQQQSQRSSGLNTPSVSIHQDGLPGTITHMADSALDLESARRRHASPPSEGTSGLYSDDIHVHRRHEAEEAVDTIIAAEEDPHTTSLSRMGLLAALAIGLHNLPEGLATFVGTMADPTAGAVIAFAIALHNIPEGIVVAMPIFYASGSKWKGFIWGCLSGATEPLGALLGYAVLRGGNMSPIVYALMFGIVAGMMIYISITELLPTALKYDPDNTVTTWAVVVGMVVMAASILLFETA